MKRALFPSLFIAAINAVRRGFRRSHRTHARRYGSRSTRYSFVGGFFFPFASPPFFFRPKSNIFPSAAAPAPFSPPTPPPPAAAAHAGHSDRTRANRTRSTRASSPADERVTALRVVRHFVFLTDAKTVDCVGVVQDDHTVSTRK